MAGIERERAGGRELEGISGVSRPSDIEGVEGRVIQTLRLVGPTLV